MLQNGTYKPAANLGWALLGLILNPKAQKGLVCTLMQGHVNLHWALGRVYMGLHVVHHDYLG